MRLTIAKELWIGFAALCLGLVIIGVLVISGEIQMREATTQPEQLLNVRSVLYQAKITHLSWLLALNDLIVSGKEFKGELSPTQCVFGKWYYKFDPFSIEGLSKAYKALEEPHRRFHESAAQIKKLCSQGNIAEAKDVYARVTEPAMAEMQEKFELIDSKILAPQIEQSGQSLAEKEKQRVPFIVLCFLLAIGLTLVIGSILVNKIAIPACGLKEFANLVAQKRDFSKRFNTKSKDEVGEITQSLNLVLDVLNKEISDAKELEMEIALNLPEFAEALKNLAARNTVEPVSEGSKNKIVSDLGKQVNKVVVIVTQVIADTEGASMDLALGLSEIFEVLKKLAQGDLLVSANEKTNNEAVSQLGKSANETIAKLREMVLAVRNNADKLASSSQQMSSSIQEINASTQEISNAITQVSKGAITQAERVEETFEIMEKSAVSLKQVVANAQTATQAVDQTTERAQLGRTAAGEAVERIERLTDSVLEATKVIQGLGQMSQQIGEITETITSIADQTNLLALNAAIEAARAGEAGRGFAVVAEEVRKLAEGSAEAVRKIGSLIKSIQSETSRAVSAIQTSSKEVQEGKSRVLKIADVLAEINKMSDEAVGLVQQISHAGQERVDEVERVVKAINEVATIAKESASTTEEITSSTQEQTASMEEMTASAQELAHLAMELKDLVGKFRLKEG